jgi:hypothetical protein
MQELQLQLGKAQQAMHWKAAKAEESWRQGSYSEDFKEKLEVLRQERNETTIVLDEALEGTQAGGLQTTEMTVIILVSDRLQDLLQEREDSVMEPLNICCWVLERDRHLIEDASELLARFSLAFTAHASQWR